MGQLAATRLCSLGLTLPETRISLHPRMFGDAESTLASYSGLTASTFRYRSGVLCLRLANDEGSMSLLPFQGQQIWDAEFRGRSLGMKSIFAEPRATHDFLSNYGALLIHCGVTAMGNPGVSDSHPLHGELPNAQYDDAALLIGDDSAGPYMALSGSLHGARAFDYHYAVSTTATLHASGSRIRSLLSLRNLSSEPLMYMYMAHINFRPVDGSVLLDTAPSPAGVRVLSEDLDPGQLDLIRERPEVHRTISTSLRYNPELVLALDCVAGPDGLVHSMQLHPDGQADFVTYNSADFDHAVRWISRSDGRDALGLLLPSTAEPEGYEAEKAKGNLKMLASQSVVSFAVEFGALGRQEGLELREKIEMAAVGQAWPSARNIENHGPTQERDELD